MALFPVDLVEKTIEQQRGVAVALPQRRAAVDRDHRPVASGTRLVDGAGEELLAGAGFTLDQDGDRAEPDPPGTCDHALHHRALVDDDIEGRGGGRKAER